MFSDCKILLAFRKLTEHQEAAKDWKNASKGFCLAKKKVGLLSVFLTECCWLGGRMVREFILQTECPAPADMQRKRCQFVPWISTRKFPCWDLLRAHCLPKRMLQQICDCSETLLCFSFHFLFKFTFVYILLYILQGRNCFSFCLCRAPCSISAWGHCSLS